MAIVVKKFGGTSVGSIEKIKNIAGHILADSKEGDDIVIVVSAMGKTTDELFGLAHEITKNPNQREMDMLVTAGERITMALLSLCLQELQIQSISFTGSQSGIITDNSHGNAKILTVNAFRISEELGKRKIVIVAGFQGVSLEKEITTLGRGGSDTTAVALSCFLNAKKCEIFTDVDGVYTADPRIVSTAKKLSRLSFEEMLYLTLYGSKVLHSRAAEFANKYQIPTEIKSSIEYTEGTMIDNKIEHSMVKAISHKENIFHFCVKLLNNEIPVFMTDVFDMDFSENVLNVWLEGQYETKFIGELDKYGFKYTKSDDAIAVINLLGYRICKDIQFFSNLHKTLKEVCQKTFYIKNQGIGVQITVEQSETGNVLKHLHDSYVT